MMTKVVARSEETKTMELLLVLTDAMIMQNDFHLDSTFFLLSNGQPRQKKRIQVLGLGDGFEVWYDSGSGMEKKSKSSI
jgi:hypothetical protein